MKSLTLYLSATFALLTFSGCTSNSQIVQLQNRTIQQSLIIQQQQRQIAALQSKLESMKHKPAYPTASVKPKKNIKLKKVEDNNYSSDYMYPDDKKTKKKTAPVTTVSQSSLMSKAECIAMIGEAKYARYTEMFGSEAAALKRCAMIRAMKK
jgi:uncharacterized protein YcfL